MSQPTIIVTGADLAQQALDLLTGYEVVYAGKTPTEDDMVALCRAHNPVAIIVRYGKVGAAVMDAAPALKVISKHGSGTDTIDKVAAKARGIEVVAAVGANAAAVAEQALALLLACATLCPVSVLVCAVLCSVSALVSISILVPIWSSLFNL